MNDNELRQRIEQLERKQRQTQRGLTLSLITLALFVTLGQAAPKKPTKTVKATQFVVVDAKGRQRAVLGMSGGGPELVLNNSQGRALLQMRIPKIPEKAALYLRDPKSQSSVELAMTTNGPVLHFSDKQGTRVRLATNELNAPLTAVYDAKGKLVFKVTAKP